ncbi:MAG: hypothetical protein LBT92_03140, partial [Rickettsiales bacterium]|nr:hypothetical protein [Rickettsiales bacterium]
MRRAMPAMLLAAASPVAASEGVDFSADHIVYDKSTGLMTAKGGVTAGYGASRMEGTELIYDSNKGEMRMDGAIRVSAPAYSISS